METRAVRDEFDVVVVGGGTAGLSGALALARSRRTVLVVDAGRPRNAPAAHLHNYLSRDGATPSALLAAGREEVAGYGGELRQGTVAGLDRDPDGRLSVRLDDGSTVTGRRLLVATGGVDELPDVPGLAARWGRDVLHCPYCHGWEFRDRAVGVLATSPLVLHVAQLWRQLSRDVTVFRHLGSELDDTARELLDALEVSVVEGTVTGLEVTEDRLTGVVLDGGAVVPREALVVTTQVRAQADVLADLGLGIEPVLMHGAELATAVPAEQSGATGVPGVWVAGNVTDPMDQLVTAAAAGLRAGAAINADLVAEQTTDAVGVLRRRRHVERARQDPPASAAAFWDGLYAEETWSRRPNPAFVREVEGSSSGRALELGCGEGADAIWLAQRGWHVAAVDVSAAALARAAEHAVAAGVADRVDWQRRDLAESFPDGSYNLVAAQYLHSPADLPYGRILRCAAEAVAPGGLLLVIGHVTTPHHDGEPLPTAAEVAGGLALDPDGWEIERVEEVERETPVTDGRPGPVIDAVVRARRRPV